MVETDAVLAESAKSDWSALVARSDAALLKTANPKAQMRQMAAGEKSSGRLQSAKAHKVTRYSQGEVLLAVDYSGETASRAIVCGFVLWSGATEGVLRIRRIESSYLPAALFKDLKSQKTRVDLAVAMAQFRCPSALIERLVGVKVQ